MKLLSKLRGRGFKFVAKLLSEFQTIEHVDETKFTTFYSNWKVETIITKSNIDDILEPIYTAIISNIQKYAGKGSGWIKLPKELNHPRKCFDEYSKF